MLNVSLATVLRADSGGRSDEPGDHTERRLLGRDELLGADGASAVDDDDLYLFPEERVLVLLDDRDGRMWQGDVVDETGFSKATVSKLLTAMEADGTIARHWEDGAKVVTLPGMGPESID